VIFENDIVLEFIDAMQYRFPDKEGFPDNNDTVKIIDVLLETAKIEPI
jgi:hypothetical protein